MQHVEKVNKSSMLAYLPKANTTITSINWWFDGIVDYNLLIVSDGVAALLLNDT